MKKIVLFFSLSLSIFLLRSQTMVVNEIMFKPGPSTGGCDQKLVDPNQPTCGREYIELYNSDCAADYDLSGYVLASANSTGSLGNAGAICFPPGTIVPAGGFLIIGGGNDYHASANAAFNYPQNSFDFKIPNYVNTPYLCLNTAGQFWFLSNFDGWMALYEPNGNVHSAVYWSSSQNNINTASDFTVNPCSPSAFTGSQLKSAKQIFQNTPQLIQYMGAPSNVATGRTFSRMPDGGAWQASLPPTIGPNRTDRCNDGSCLSCGSLVLEPSDATCGQPNGSIVATVMDVVTSPPPYTYTLTGPVTQNITTSVNPYTFQNLPPGNYTVIVVDNFNPPNTTEKQATVNNSGSISTEVSSTPSNCGNPDGTATATPTGGTTYQFRWSTTPQQTSQTAINLTPGNYTVTVTSMGCETSATVEVPNVGGPSATASATPSYCGRNDGTVTVSASGGAGNYQYAWSNGASTQTLTNLAPGTYTVTVSDGGVCPAQASATVQNIPGPVAAITAEPIFLPPGTSTNLESSGSGNPTQFLWNLGDNNTAITPSVTHFYNDAGTYNVVLTVTDANGCTSSASVIITVVSINIPNVITPNSDGVNDTFVIQGLEGVENKQLKIFNRWGKRVYENPSYQNDWDAGNLASGVYYYVLKVPDIEKEFHGTVTVLRN